MSARKQLQELLAAQKVLNSPGLTSSIAAARTAARLEALESFVEDLALAVLHGAEGQALHSVMEGLVQSWRENKIT